MFFLIKFCFLKIFIFVKFCFRFPGVNREIVLPRLFEDGEGDVPRDFAGGVPRLALVDSHVPWLKKRDHFKAYIANKNPSSFQ